MVQITENQTAQTEIGQTESNTVLFTFVSWLFLIGSLIFQIDAILEFMEGFSIHVILHLLASLLFTIGSILFVIHDAHWITFTVR